MSPEEVLASEEKQEDSKLIENNGFWLTYEMQIYGTEAKITYICNLSGLEYIKIKVTSPAFGAENLNDTVNIFISAFNCKYGIMKKSEAVQNSWVTPKSYIMLLSSAKGHL